jgi:hypothetical protein
MSLIKLQGNASGTGAFTIAAPNSNTDRTLTLPDATGTVVTADGSGNIATTSITPSAGIYLGGSGSANLLDDYEEGTWTPAIDPGVSYSGTLTLSGNYTKIGRLVWINFRVVVSGGSVSVGTGGQLVTGLPFAVAVDNVGGYGVGQNNTTGAAIVPYAYGAVVSMSAAATTSNGFYGTVTYSAA